MWDRKTPFALGYDIWTRVVVDPTVGLGFVVCKGYHENPKLRLFLGVVWPHEALMREEAIMDHNVCESRGSDVHVNVPSHMNLYILNPARLHDAVITGGGVCRRPKGKVGNTQFKVLSLGGDRKGSSTQYVTFGHHESGAWQYAPASVKDILLWEDMLMHSRKHLREYFRNRRQAGREWIPSEAARKLMERFVCNKQEGQGVEEVKAKHPEIAGKRVPNRVTLSTGPERWIRLRNLPLTPQNAVAALVHVVLGVHAIRARVVRCMDDATSLCMAVLRGVVVDLWQAKGPTVAQFKGLSKEVWKAAVLDASDFMQVLSFVVESLLGMGVTYGNLHVGEGGNAEESFLRQIREQFFGRIISSEVCFVEVVSEGEFEVGLSEVQSGIWELQGVAHMVDGMWEVVVQRRNIRGSWRRFECCPTIVVEHLLDMRQKIRKEG